jgi:uncharacterized protein YaiL (DUF2058 family)
MSLRDQLLAKGIVSKKDVRRVDQQQRQERRDQQGSKARKSELEAAAREAAAAAEAEATRVKLEQKKAREAAREAVERANQLRQIVVANAIRSRGKFRFFHRKLDGVHIGRMEVSERVARSLRVGELGIAAIDDGEDAEYVVISARAARRLRELAPERVVHLVEDLRGLGDGGEGLFEADWEIGLVARRA